MAYAQGVFLRYDRYNLDRLLHSEPVCGLRLQVVLWLVFFALAGVLGSIGSGWKKLSALVCTDLSRAHLAFFVPFTKNRYCRFILGGGLKHNQDKIF
jgi:hypothetical protein